MRWKAPWTKPTPVDALARAIAEEEAALSNQMAEIRERMETIKNPPQVQEISTVRRGNKTESLSHMVDQGSLAKKAPQRIHRAQQKRDRNLFLLLLPWVLLLLVLIYHAMK